MERLTDKKEADAQRREYEIRLKQGYPRNIPEERFLRLAAYEETGLEPEDFKRAFSEDTILKLAGQALGITPDRLRELAQADREGRVKIEPKARKCPKCGKMRLFQRIDWEYYYCYSCKTQFTSKEVEAALRREQE